MIRVIGIGSPFGDDAAGLVVAQTLAAAPPPGAEVVVADRPGADLLELLDGVEAVILIDAVQSGAPLGTLHDLDLEALPQEGFALVSSHALGVAEAVQLARALGRTPARGRLLGIEAAPARAASVEEMTPTTGAAVERAVRRVHEWVERLTSVT